MRAFRGFMHRLRFRCSLNPSSFKELIIGVSDSVRRRSFIDAVNSRATLAQLAAQIGRVGITANQAEPISAIVGQGFHRTPVEAPAEKST